MNYVIVYFALHTHELGQRRPASHSGNEGRWRGGNKTHTHTLDLRRPASRSGNEGRWRGEDDNVLYEM